MSTDNGIGARVAFGRIAIAGTIGSLATCYVKVIFVALTWLGRGTYDKAEWDSAVSQARDAHNEHTARYLLGMPKLGDYLEEGLSQLGYFCEEYETGRM